MNNKFKIYMLALVCFVIGTMQFSIVGMLDKIANSIGVSVATAGQLVTAYALSNAIGTPIAIVSMSKMNQRKQLLAGLTIIFLGIICMVSSSQFIVLMIARGVLGIGTGVFIVNAYGAAAKLADKGREGSAMSNVAMGFSSSLVFGVPIGRIIASHYQWQTIFWVMGIFIIASMVMIKKGISDLKAEEAIPLSKRFTALKNPKILLMLMVTLFVFMGFSIIDTYITPFLSAVNTNMQDKISIILMILGIGSLIGSKLGGSIADKIGISRTIFIAIIVQCIALIAATIFNKSMILVVIMLMIWEIACWSFGPTQNFNLASLAPEASGIALSLNSTFVQLGFAIGAGVGGVVITKLSIMAITWMAAISVGISIIILGFGSLKRKEKRI